MATLELQFPKQQTLSISETINTDFPQFIPHHEIIFYGISDLFESKLSALSGISYLDTLKSGSNADKAIAAEIALWHNQRDYAQQCVADIEGDALCKRMQLMMQSAEERKQIKDDAGKAAFDGDDEMKFVLHEYNLETPAISPSDPNAIEDLLHKAKTLQMRPLIDGGKCSWRFHLIYAELCCRTSLDNQVVDEQITAAQKKLGGDANSHYAFLALTGDIYCRMRLFDKARDALTKGAALIKGEGYCRSRLIYCHLHEQQFDAALQLWNECITDLKAGGVSDDLINCYSRYLQMNADPDDEKNNAAILEWEENDEHSFVGTSLKLYILAFKDEKYKEDKFAIAEDPAMINNMSWLDKTDSKATGASHKQRMIAGFLGFAIDLWQNDALDDYSMAGGFLDNVFSTLPKPCTSDMLDVIGLQSYLRGMLQLRWKGDCKKAFRFSIICNCRLNMSAYVGEVVGYQNSGNPATAVEKIKEIQKFVNVEALQLFPIDAQRLGGDMEAASNELIALIRNNNENWDAILALADIYMTQGKWQPALLLMQQVIEAECMSCSKNLELKMKWATILYFNGYVPLANQVFKEYAIGDNNASEHEYYCGIAANILYELGSKQAKSYDKMHLAKKLKGSNVWMYRHLCYKNWVEFIVKDKKKKRGKQPAKDGKSQYDKAVAAANRLIDLDAEFPLGHALWARSNIEMVGVAPAVTEEVIEEKVNTAEELADKLMAEKTILPQMYYETMIHCGVAMYQIDKDGSKYYAKATDNAPHGETPLLKAQRERITSKMDTQATRELMIEIQKGLSSDLYKKALPLFEYDFEATVEMASKWTVFEAHSDLTETGSNGMNITKPDAKPAGGGGAAPKKKAKKESPKKKEPAAEEKKEAASSSSSTASQSTDSNNQSTKPVIAKNAKKSVPYTDDEKGMGMGMSSMMMDDDNDGMGGMDACGPSIESPFRYANLCGNCWPKETLTFSMPFDDALYLGEALTMVLRKLMKNEAPSNDDDLIGRLHWGGEDALGEVIDKCKGKDDALNIGLMNFACTHKVDLNGLGSEDDHVPVLEKLPDLSKTLTYEGKIGFATVMGLQGRTFEAKDMFDQVAKEKDANGSDWLYHRQYGYYLLMVTHEYGNAVSEFEKAYKGNTKKDPMTIGWYIAALSKSGTPQDLKTMATVFGEIGFHESDTDVAVIREEFLKNFDIKSPLEYETLAKSGPTPLFHVRKLICSAKYNRDEIRDKATETKPGIKICTDSIKASGTMMFKCAIEFFKAQAQWFYNNSLRQNSEMMTSAGMISMDWPLAPTFGAYCQAKLGNFDEASPMLEYLPQKGYDPMFTCAAMVGETVSQTLEDDRAISPLRFIARINHLRFGAKKTNSDQALKELTTEFLTKYKHDFNGLVALGDIWLSRGASKCAYHVYYTIKSKYPQQYRVNFLLRLKFAECMRLNGFQSSALAEFRSTFACFDEKDKKYKEEMEYISDVLIGYALLCIGVGSYVEAEKVLKVCSRRHKLKPLAEGHLTLLKGGDANGVYEDCKQYTDNPLMLALAVRAGKMSGGDTSGEETALKALIGGKFANIEAVKEYCEISAGIKSDSSGQCLTNNILTAIVKAPDAGSKIYDALKGVYDKNPTPSSDEIFGAVGSCGVNAVGDDSNVTVINNAEAPQIEDITDDYAKMASTAEDEIKAMHSGKVMKAEAKSKGGKSGKKGKRKSVQTGGAPAESAGGGGAGPKPNVDYKKTPLEKRKQWAFDMAAKLGTPAAKEVAKWSVEQVGQFIKQIPIWGLNEWYGNKFIESQVTGQMFLKCNERALSEWGVDRKCHRARFRAEALAMKRRG